MDKKLRHFVFLRDDLRPRPDYFANLSLFPTAAGEESCKKKGGRKDGLVQDNILVQECGILMP